MELMPRAQAAYRKMVAGLPALLSREPDKAESSYSGCSVRFG
jgi:hypothetical protein